MYFGNPVRKILMPLISNKLQTPLEAEQYNTSMNQQFKNNINDNIVHFGEVSIVT